MKALSYSVTLKKDKSWFFETMIFLFFFLNIADLLNIYVGIFKLRASYGFNFLFFPFMLSKGNVISKKFLWGFLIFSLLCAASSLNSSLFWRSFSYYLQEIYILAGCFFVAAWVMRTFETRKVLSIYLTVYLVIAVYGLFQFFAPFIGVQDPFVFQTIGEFYNRPNSVCLEPAYFSYYLSFVLCGFGVYTALSPIRSFKQTAILFTLSFAALFSMTTTALVQFCWICGLSLLLFLIYKKKNLFAFCLPLLAAAFIYIMALLVSPVLAWPVVGKFVEDDGSLTSGPDVTRVELATSAWEYFKHHPFFGYSYGGLGPLVSAQGINEESENLALLEGLDYWEKDPQPIPFQLLASFGIVGVIAFVIASLLFMRKGFIAYKLNPDLGQKQLIIASLASLSSIVIGGVWMMGPFIPAVWVHLGLCYGLWGKLCIDPQEILPSS